MELIQNTEPPATDSTHLPLAMDERVREAGTAGLPASRNVQTDEAVIRFEAASKRRWLRFGAAFAIGSPLIAILPFVATFNVLKIWAMLAIGMPVAAVVAALLAFVSGRTMVSRGQRIAADRLLVEEDLRAAGPLLEILDHVQGAWLWPRDYRLRAIDRLAAILPDLTADEVGSLTERRRRIWYAAIRRSGSESFAAASLPALELSADPRSVSALRFVAAVHSRLASRAENLIRKLERESADPPSARLLRICDPASEEELLRPIEPPGGSAN